MAKPELGEKQICPSCGAKFYDLTRRPAHCPKCNTDFDPEEAVRARKSVRRSPADDIEDEDETADAAETAKKPAPADDDDGYGEETDDTPEIDQVDATEVVADDEDDAAETPGKPAASSDDDLGVDFAEDEDSDDEDDDVTFLEDDEDFNEDEIEGLPGENEERD